MTKSFSLLSTLLVSSVALTGCFNSQQQTPPPTSTNYNPKPAVTLEDQLARQSQIVKFDSYDELAEFLKNSEASSGGRGAYYYGDAVEEMAFDSSTNMAAPAPSAPGVATRQVTAEQGFDGGGDYYSTTNIQVAGVDEADIIKTDGDFIYVVVKQDLFIIDATPAQEATIVSKIAFDARPQDIYLNDNRLVIYGSDYFVQPLLREAISFRPGSQETFVKVFDISDKKNPRQVRDLSFEGGYANSRMIGEYMYLVTNNYNYYYIEDQIPLPRIMENGETLTTDCSQKCFAPDVYYFDRSYNSFNFTSINAINIFDDSSDITGDVYLLDGSQNLFVSQDNMYVTYTKYLTEYDIETTVLRDLLYSRLSAEDKQKITAIENAEEFILSDQEKKYKVRSILERYGQSLALEEQKSFAKQLETTMQQRLTELLPEMEKTVVHKIAIDGASVDYQTFAEVPGQVLNQFSMDEQGGYFRIATTRNQTWSRYFENQTESYNNLYILDENMNRVGAVERLAEGEQIYSVRFMQNRAYMVTFERVDPLFVIDLENPRNPKVLGQLKIPGFSNYLHPYDENFIIGLGKDTKIDEYDNVRTQGVKLSLFDVSNVADPKEVDVVILGDSGSNSIAEQDHKAFLFSKDRNLLVLPMSITQNQQRDDFGRFNFAGAVVFSVDENGFEERGRIDHNDGELTQVDWWGGYRYYDNTVKRSLYIGDTLYTFSNNYLKMHNLDTLSEQNSLRLIKERSGSTGDFEIIN